MTPLNSPKVLKASAISILKNDNGSAIIIALLVLVIISIIGVSSSNIQTTESYILRNTAIHKQNVLMMDAVGIEAAQRIKDAGYIYDYGTPNKITISNINPDDNPKQWVHDEAAWTSWAANWYAPNSGRILDTSNSVAPFSLDQGLGTGVASILADRGEANGANSDLRYALIGWRPIPGDTIVETEEGLLHGADLLVEYVSPNYGLTRLTLGVRKRW